MTFMNKKEEIIQFELTTYGRHLLSQGKLKPEYYAFYDDDILYDIGKANSSETQGQIKKRILEETPYLRTQVSFSDLDRRLYKTENIRFEDDISYPITEERENYMLYPIGTSNMSEKQMAPCWDVKYLHGSSSSATKVLKNTSSDLSLPYREIPQINFNLDYEIEVKNHLYEDEDTSFLDKTNPNQPLTATAVDGTYVSIKESQLMAYILEKNGFNYNDSFEIEVFLEDDTDNKVLIPLRFFDTRTPIQQIENDLLLSADELSRNYDPSFIEDLDDPRYVEHYFNFRVDSEIPEEEVCNGALRLKKKDIYVDLEYECLERDIARDISIYGTRVTVDDIEECE
jgi:hypothetical protein